MIVVQPWLQANEHKENMDLKKDLIFLRDIIDKVRCLTHCAASLHKPYFGYKNLLDYAEKNDEPLLAHHTKKRIMYNEKKQHAINKVLQKRIEQSTQSHETQSATKVTRLKVDLERGDWLWKDRFN